jgi:hypothetical protein
MRALGKAQHIPFSPAASRSEPMEAVWPMQNVATGGRMNCMVS